MAQVTVTINGRVYRMGCDEGQESVLTALAQDLDRRIDSFKESFGEVGDMRLLIMAALEISDELSEARRQLEALRASDTAGAAAEALAAAALRVERLTATLNGTGMHE